MAQDCAVTSAEAAERGAGGGLTIGQGAALTIGAVLGTGVITLPALAADLAGPASLLAWLALVLLSVPLAVTFAALGARYPDWGACRPTPAGRSARGWPPWSAGASMRRCRSEHRPPR